MMQEFESLEPEELFGVWWNDWSKVKDKYFKVAPELDSGSRFRNKFGMTTKNKDEDH